MIYLLGEVSIYYQNDAVEGCRWKPGSPRKVIEDSGHGRAREKLERSDGGHGREAILTPSLTRGDCSFRKVVMIVLAFFTALSNTLNILITYPLYLFVTHFSDNFHKQ